ncbi:hypothetical protein MCELHM10_02037 [Paracoccaceae bacterium]|jgi:hypothetical protein
MSVASYLKKHTEALVKDVGVEAAATITGKSKATLGRYYSDSNEHDDRFMPIDVVAALESSSRFPHVTSALADLRGITLSYDTEKREPATSGVNQDVVALAQRFGMLMAEYNLAIGDGKISINEAKRLLRETLAIQQVLLEMKLNLEDEAS